MARKKEFTYSVNVDTKQANDNLKNTVVNIDITNKSINQLTKELRRQVNIYKQLSEEKRKSELGAQVAKNIEQIQEALKKANAGLKITTNQAEASASGIQKAISKAFAVERVTQGIEKLSKVGDFQSLEDGADKFGDAIGSLDPRLKIIAEVGKAAFKQILAEIRLTEGGSRKLEGVFGGLKEALNFRNIVSLLSLPLALANSKKIAEDFRKGQLSALKKFDLERENALREQAIKEIDLNKQKNDAILNDNRNSFAKQAELLKEGLKLDLQASFERQFIAQNELEIFKQQKDIRKLIEARGADFVKELNGEQLKKYTEIQGKITTETQNRAIKQIEFEKQYIEAYRQEQERLLQIFTANQNKIIEKNAFTLENERLSLEKALELTKQNFEKKKAIIQAELAVLDAQNKQDEVKFVELNNKKLALERDYQKQVEQLKREFADREIALQEAKNVAIIELNNKYNELFRGTLEEQVDRIEDNASLQLDINAKKIANLNQQDKDYLTKLQQLENERQNIINAKNEAILKQSLAFYDNLLQEQQKAIEIATLQAQIGIERTNSDLSKQANDLQKQIDELIEKSSKSIIEAIKNNQTLKQAQQEAYEARVQQLEIQAKLEQAQNAQQISINNAQIDRLTKELAFNEQLSEARKKQIEQEIELLKLRNEELGQKGADIQINLQINKEKAEKDLKNALKDINKVTIETINTTISKVQEGFAAVSDFFTKAIEYQLLLQTNAINAQIEQIDAFLERNEEAIDKLSELEQNATGARKRRLEKERKELEKAQKEELKNKENLEKQKEEAERAAKEKQKIFQIGQVIIDTAAGIAKAVSQFPSTFGLPFSAFVAATGALQIATIQATKFARGGIAYEGGYIPAEGGMIVGRSHAQGGVRFVMGEGIGEADGAKGEAYIINTKNNPALKKLASDINVLGGGKAFFAQGGVVNPTITPSAIGIINQEQRDKAMQEAIIEAIKQEKVVVPVDLMTERMQNYLSQKNKSKK